MSGRSNGDRWNAATCATRTTSSGRSQARRPWAVMHFAAYAYVGEFDGRTGEVLRQQYRRDRQAAPGLRRIRLRELRVLELLRDLWRPRAPSHHGGRRAEPGQPVRLHQARGRTHAQGRRGRLWDPARGAALLQCGRRRPGWRARRAAPARDPPHSRWSCSPRWGETPSVKIFGNDYPTPDGTCIRDYVHVSDLADAHVAALDWLAKGNPSQSFNLGNGRGFSVAEVVQTSEKVTGRSVPPRCARGARATRRSLSATSAKRASCWAGRRNSRPGSADHACVDLVPRQDAEYSGRMKVGSRNMRCRVSAPPECPRGSTSSSRVLLIEKNDTQTS